MWSNPNIQAIGFEEGGAADFDAAGLYRYGLWRTWNWEYDGGGDNRIGRHCTFIMLNPSTATVFENDPTIRRCIGFAKSWGYEALTIGNLFAYRSTSQKKLSKVSDPVGPSNDESILSLCKEAQIVIAAWGNEGKLYGRDKAVLKLLNGEGVVLHHLGQNRRGEPKHPLYLPGDLQPQRWNYELIRADV